MYDPEPLSSPPTVDFDWSIGGMYGVLTYQFDAECVVAPDHEICSYFWQFGDGQSKHLWYDGAVWHEYACEGTYTVILTVRDEYGREWSAAKEIPVIEVMRVSKAELELYPSPVVVGVVENLSSKFIWRFHLQANFYDSEGGRVCGDVVEMHDLDPGERVRFEIPAEEPSYLFWEGSLDEIVSVEVLVRDFEFNWWQPEAIAVDTNEERAKFFPTRDLFES